MSQENVEIARSALDAFNRGDLDATSQARDPDAALDFSRALGPYRGVHRLADFRRFLADFSGTFE
jgi:hypothetical protein